MNRIKTLFNYIHLFGWFLIFLFFNWMVYGENVRNPLYTAAILTVNSLLVFYAHFGILTRYLTRKRIGIYILLLFVILLAGPFSFIFPLGVEIKDVRLPLEYLPFLALTFLMVLLSGLARATENWFINAFKRQALEKQAIQAELSYLKWQINPHFLFNTLNNIHALAYKQSASTPEAILRLSALMRYMLYEANAGTVALTKEIDYLKNFISLQQLRYENEPVVELRIKGDTSVLHIAPLLLIQLLENAYKHSPAELNIGDIKINVETTEHTLLFAIENPVAANRTAPMDGVGGIGLSNVRKRLQLLYPGRHNFGKSEAKGFFKVILEIDRLHLQNHERKADMLYSG